jgi:formate hydrogenlyase subunit 4
VGLKKNNWKFNLGIIILALSILLFLSLPVIPFLPFENKTRITVSTIVFVVAEVTFYSGGFLLGKELFSKYKSYLNPKNWFKKNKEDLAD